MPIRHSAKGEIAQRRERGSRNAISGRLADGSLASFRLEKVAVSGNASASRGLFHASVDVSGSMAGSRTNEAIRGLKRVFDDVMRPNDLFGLATFEGSVRRLHQLMAKKRVDWQKDDDHIRANAGGRTALYDAIESGLGELKEAQAYQREVAVGNAPKPVPIQLVITDGADNCSRMTLQEVTDLVARHDRWNRYRFYLVAVGIDDATARDMAAICRPAHARLLRACNLHELREHLVTVAEQVRLSLCITAPGGGRMQIHAQGEMDEVRGLVGKLNLSPKVLGHRPAALAAPAPAPARPGHAPARPRHAPPRPRHAPPPGRPRHAPAPAPAKPAGWREPCKHGQGCTRLRQGTCGFYHPRRK